MKFSIIVVNHHLIDTSITHIRPRFKLELWGEPAAIMRQLDDFIEAKKGELKGKVITHHITMDIVDRDAHFWSPQLNFREEQHEEKAGVSLVSGLIGPRPEVWTMFVFIYFVIGLFGFGISSYGIVQWTLGETPYNLIGFPITIGLLLTAYQAGKYGERLASEQVDFLKQCLREALDLSRKQVLSSDID